MSAELRILGRFRTDTDPRFKGPHAACFDCDLVFPERSIGDECPFCHKVTGDCGGPRQGTFLGCGVCNREGRR